MRMTAVQFLRSAYAHKEGLPFQKSGSSNGRQQRNHSKALNRSPRMNDAARCMADLTGCSNLFATVV